MRKYLHRPFHKPDYEIISNDMRFFESLYLQYGGYITNTVCENPYRITVAKEKIGGRYIFEHIADKTITNNPMRMFDDILFETTEYDEKVIPLHGMAVEYGGYAYIFLAPTTSGKTTLAVYLLYNGFRYITEDCVLIDKQAFGVYPYLCPVHMRTGGVDVLKRYGIVLPDIKILDLHNDVRYVYTPDKCAKILTPLGGIFFITRSETENSVTGMTVSESIIELMKSGMTVYRPTADHIRLMTELARTGCKRLVYRDMEYVKDMITGGI